MTTPASLYPPDQPLGEAELYLRHEVETYPADDRRRLCAFLGEPIEGGLAVMA